MVAIEVFLSPELSSSSIELSIDWAELIGLNARKGKDTRHHETNTKRVLFHRIFVCELILRLLNPLQCPPPPIPISLQPSDSHHHNGTTSHHHPPPSNRRSRRPLQLPRRRQQRRPPKLTTCPHYHKNKHKPAPTKRRRPSRPRPRHR